VDVAGDTEIAADAAVAVAEDATILGMCPQWTPSLRKMAAMFRPHPVQAAGEVAEEEIHRAEDAEAHRLAVIATRNKNDSQPCRGSICCSLRQDIFIV
jgi:hypothetical protein